VNTDKYGKVSFGAFEDFSSRSKNIKNGTNRGVSVFRFDRDDTIGCHINTVRGDQIDKVYFPDSDKQRQVINNFNHKTVGKHTYKIFKDFDRHAKVIRIGSRVLSITGGLLDLLEILETIHIDKHDADGKIGKLSWSAGASIVGSGSLGFLGAKGGALLGATIGNVFPGPGTAIGGVIGGLVFGIMGSFSGSKLGECVIDITMAE